MAKNKLSKIAPEQTGKFKSREEAAPLAESLKKQLYDLLYLMFAHDKHSLLIILH